MADYNSRMAITDLGFLYAFVYISPTPDDNDKDDLFDWALDVLERLDKITCDGTLLAADKLTPEVASRFLRDLGLLRGLLWRKSTPETVSETLARVIRYFTDTSEWLEKTLVFTQQFETREQSLSDEQRDSISRAITYDDEDTLTSAFADKLGAPLAAITHHWRRAGAIDGIEEQKILAEAAETSASNGANEVVETGPTRESESVVPAIVEESTREAAPVCNPFNLNGLRGRREWTPEQRAEAADRARNLAQANPLIADSDFEKVRADWETGMPFRKLGLKYNCSDGHIRNFLKKHGVDPRRGGPGGRKAKAEEELVTVEPTSTGKGEASITVEATVPPSVNAASPAETWKSSPLKDDDWSDISGLLAKGASRESIASDYDVPVDDLNRFVEGQLEAARQRRNSKDVSTVVCH